MGYAQVGANVGFTMLSVPLALRYLGKEEFGLWALAQQISGYFLLIDLGLSSAMSRLLANHKDDLNGGSYGSLLLTGGFVFAVQGALLAVLGSLFALIAPPLFNIPETLGSDFRNVLVISSVLSGAAIALRSITAPLWAFQRLDISYGFGVVSLVGALCCLWLGFQAGWGI
jgi:O-antigen/teichoic acid export membrane protein